MKKEECKLRRIYERQILRNDQFGDRIKKGINESRSCNFCKNSEECKEDFEEITAKISEKVIWTVGDNGTN